MKIVVSIILNHPPTDNFVKNLTMLTKQDFLQNPNNSLEIIVRDNNQGIYIEEIKKLSKEISIENIYYTISHNTSFEKVHNEVFSYTKSQFEFDYFLVVNSDGIPHPKMIKYLVDFAYNHNNQGIFEALQFPLENAKTYDRKTKNTNWCSMYCCLFPFKVFEKLQGFDERLSAHITDVDISWRARVRGYFCYTVDHALFSYCTTDKEENLERKNILLHKASYKLAMKYNNKTFSKKMLSILKKHISKKELIVLENETKNIYNNNYHKYKNIADFKNGIMFSEKRW